MSTRYVWGKYNVDCIVTKEQANTNSVSGTNTSDKAPWVAHNYSVSIDEGVVYYSPILGGPVTFTVGESNNSRNIPVSEKTCVFDKTYYVSGKGYRRMYLVPDGITQLVAVYSYSGTGFGNVSIRPSSGQFATAASTLKAGTFIENLSSSSSSSYPNGGVSGQYWYSYLGSDNIDPVEISYQTVVDYLGEKTPFTYKITPSRLNVYGGIVSYNISYSKNGGSWVDGTNWSTELTGERYITDNTWKTYRLRVRAKDNLGFTSTTWIQGPVGNVSPDLSVSLSVSPSGGGTVEGGGPHFSGTSVTVKATPANGWEFVGWQENGTTVSTSASYTFTITASRNLTAVFKQKLTAWVGVDGKARKGVEMYVGVNGKARKVVEAYIGVNGKARRFL